MITFKDNNKVKNINMILLIMIIILQPILDTFYLYSDKLIEIIGFSPATIIRMVLVGICFLLTFLMIKNEKKWISIILYAIVMGSYLILHQWHCANFTSSIPENVQYSFFSEVFYVIRLVLPLLVIFITYNNKPKDEIFEKVILCLVIMISGSIVITNFFEISLGSYTNEIIKGSMFEWLFNGYGNLSFSDFASKGFFYFANRASTALIFLLPLSFYYFIRKVTVVKGGILVLHMLSMLMLGTKVATIGGLLVIITMLFIYIFFGLIKSDVKINLLVLISIVAMIGVWGYILPKSPAIYREQIASNVSEKEDANTKKEEIEKEVESIGNDGDSNKTLEEKKIAYIKKNYERMRINPDFILDSYPYENDPDFWISIFQEPASQRMNYRYIETRMVERVKELNDNKLDDWFGIGYSRVTSIYNIERDFLLQYYALGYIGVILLIGPMVMIVLMGLVFSLIKFREKFTMENISLIASGFLALAVSWYSGNSLDSLFISIILAFILGKLMINMFSKEDKYDRI